MRAALQASLLHRGGDRLPGGGRRVRAARGRGTGHADRIAARIAQLRGEPDFDPDTLSLRSHAEYDSSTDLAAMLREDLVAERVAIASYTEIAQWIGSGDPTTRRMLEEILAVEEEHAEDLLSLLEGHGIG